MTILLVCGCVALFRKKRQPGAGDGPGDPPPRAPYTAAVMNRDFFVRDFYTFFKNKQPNTEMHFVLFCVFFAAQQKT